VGGGWWGAGCGDLEAGSGLAGFVAVVGKGVGIS